MKKSLLLSLLLLLLPLGSIAQLVSVSSFGSNPGNLTMYRYSPSGVPSNAPLVVVLHGCTQDATTFANETEWNKLANQYGFHVIYPEQKSGNNSSKCFNWFEESDINRGQGEALSIKQMVDYMKNNFSIDASRVYVTGLSAGGAMTAVMCAVYPEVFAGGAVMAGVPYRAGVGISGAFSAMSPGVNRTPQQWGDLVRQENPSFTGNYPKMSIFHGSSDNTVKILNMTELADQWTNLCGADATVDITNANFDGVSNVTQRVYTDSNGSTVVVSYELTGMGHAISVDPGTGVKQGGNTGGYSVDRNFWSSYWAADFFGLLAPATAPASPSNLVASSISDVQINLSWTDNATTESNFVVERSLNSGGAYSVVATLPANTTTFQDINLSANTTYYYRVKATNGAGSSAFSNLSNATTAPPDLTTPNAPTNLVADVVSSTEIDLTWVDNASNELNFVVERSLNAETGFNIVATLPANTTTYSDTELALNTPYFYRVSATNNNGSSALSNQASATTLNLIVTTDTIAQPQGNFYISTLNNVNTGQSFTAESEGEIVAVSFKLYSAASNSTLRIYAGNTVSGTPLYTQNINTTAGGWQTFTLTTPFAVNANQQYTLQLTNASIAYNSANVYSGGSFWYNTINYTVYEAAFEIILQTLSEGGTTPPPPPTTTVNAPTSLNATAISSSQINLTWIDNSSNEANFVIERSLTATTGFTVIATLPANTTTYNNTGLSQGTTYFYRVKATNTEASSDYSNQASASTQTEQVSTYTIAQNNGNFYLSTLNNINTGQSITTQGAGQMTQVAFKLYSAINNSTLRIYLGNTTSGTPIYSQNVSTTAGGWQTFTLTTPLAVNANQQYTIILTNASVAYNASNVYAGGHLWYNTIAYTGFDAAFSVTIQNAVGSRMAENMEEQLLNPTAPVANDFFTEEISLNVYPNPASDQIRVSGLGADQATLVLYDATGRIVFQTFMKENDNIDVSKLNRGTYHLLIKANGKTFQKTIILQ